MNDVDEKRRWGPEQRIEFIEFCLFWEGRINRSDIVNRFDVSVPQASTDLTLYQKLAPGNVDYDTGQKCYLPSATFTPRFLVPNADRYLIQLRAIADDVIALKDTPIQNLPDADVVPIPRRRVEPQILKPLVQAIRSRSGLKVHYRSMNAKLPDARWREISPHAFVHDGLRWHVRAYCHEKNTFKDFVLSRFLQIGAEIPSGTDASKDKGWFSFFEVVLVPNPKLSEPQRETIALDYGMSADKMIVLRVRCALLYYFEKVLRLDMHDEKTPEVSPIVIANRVAFDQARAKASSM